MYGKYTARPAVFYFLFFPFYSALGIIFGAPKRYLYFWGRWSPFTVRIFLWHYEKRTLNALGF